MAAAKKPSAPIPLERFGFKEKPGWGQLEYDMAAFAHRIPVDQGALPRDQHFWRIADGLFPGGKLCEKNPWTMRAIKSLCDNPWLGMMGCGSSSKTFSSAFFACIWWLCLPEDSIVILTSTTMKMIRKRAWPIIQSVYTAIPGPRIGNMVDSRHTWQCRKGDDKHAIFMVGVKDGDASAAAADIQGMHARRILVIVDEATDTPEAIFDVTANLQMACDDFQFVCAGNPNGRFDQFGRFCEPIDGWDSIGIDDEEWEARGKKGGRHPLIIRFDGEKSPNVLAKTNKWRHLVTLEQLNNDRESHGVDSPQYWKYIRGFMAPEGVCRTVMSDVFCQQHDVRGRLLFRGDKMFMLSALDAAFGGGDRARQIIAKAGTMPGGYLAVQIIAVLTIDVNSFKKETMHYQIAAAARKNCELHGVPPENFAFDASGEGGGLGSIMVREWSPNVVWVESGGKASKEPMSGEDIRLCSEVYYNRVAEMWFRVKAYCEMGQLKGLGIEPINEFCARIFYEERRLLKMETKLDMKRRCGQSPDHADAVAILVDLAKRRGVALRASKGVEAIREQAKVVNVASEEVYSELNYSAGEDPYQQEGLSA